MSHLIETQWPLILKSGVGSLCLNSSINFPKPLQLTINIRISHNSTVIPYSRYNILLSDNCASLPEQRHCQFELHLQEGAVFCTYCDDSQGKATPSTPPPPPPPSHTHTPMHTHTPTHTLFRPVQFEVADQFLGKWKKKYSRISKKSFKILRQRNSDDSLWPKLMIKSRDGDCWEFYGSVRFSVLLLRFGFITVS